MSIKLICFDIIYVLWKMSNRPDVISGRKVQAAKGKVRGVSRDW